MLNDSKRIADTLPPSAQLVANHVYHSVSTGQVTSNESRTSLALVAGVREMLVAGEFLTSITDASIRGNLPHFAVLIGYADAYSRRIIGALLSASPFHARLIAGAIGIRGLSRQGRINGIFRHAQNLASKF